MPTENDRLFLLEYVREKAADEPLKKRVRLYRAAADACGNEAKSTELRAMADMLERTDALCGQFSFLR